jgi:hypothetical protein
MPYKKGNPKMGGRVKGTKNKKTVLLENFATSICKNGVKKFKTELNKLTGKPYVDAYLAIFEYVRPKLARSEITGKDGQEIKVVEIIKSNVDYSKLPEDILQQIINAKKPG